MEELNFSKVLGAASFNDELDSKTFDYRINNFIYVCGFDLDSNKCNRAKFIYEDSYIQGLVFNRDEDDECNFFVTKKNDSDRGKYLYMEGHKKDLDFIFNNYYGKKKIDKRIIDLPFDIYLTKKYLESNYQLIIQTICDVNNRFTIIKDNNQEICFYANILDFSKVLKIVKSFVNNPELVLNAYTEIMNKKRVSFTNTDLNKVIENDDKLEKPGNKFVKKLRMITNND